MPPAGLEQPSKTSGNTALSEAGGAESGAVGAAMGVFPSDLAMVVSGWHTLSDADRKAVLEIVKEATECS